jgi:UDP-N-acetylmuramate dehydrogenase
MNALGHELRERFGNRLQAEYPLAALTSFQIGGPADLFFEVENERELMDAAEAAYRHRVNYFCLGSGTNLLVSDRGMRGLVIKLGVGFAALTINGLDLSAGAAAQFGTIVQTAVEHRLAGLEFGEGIPGTVGGGLVMNAGAFGGEMARVVTAVHGVTATGEARALTPDQVQFTYRCTELPPRFVITRVDFHLERGDREALQARVAELKAKRAARQPAGVPNAGSVFKNPPGSFAGQLIEGAGLKGAQLGGAAFSQRHANFIVNLGGARAEEVRGLIDMARHRVKETSGVWLDPEVRLVGEW